MPMIPAVIPQSEGFGEPAEIFRPRAVRKIGSDGISSFLKADKALWPCRHKGTNTGCTLGFDAWSDIHQHHCSTHRLWRLAFSQKGGHTAQRGADQHRALRITPYDTVQVGHKGINGVIAIRGPVAVPVAAHVEGHRIPSALGQALCCRPPGVPRLAAAV